jgi:hypothetical protein
MTSTPSSPARCSRSAMLGEVSRSTTSIRRAFEHRLIHNSAVTVVEDSWRTRDMSTTIVRGGLLQCRCEAELDLLERAREDDVAELDEGFRTGRPLASVVRAGRRGWVWLCPLHGTQGERAV